MWLIFCRNEFLLQTEIGSRPVYGANCVLAIGNWSNPQGSTCRGPSTMCVGLRRKLARRFDCIDIDEVKCVQDVMVPWKNATASPVKMSMHH